MKILFVISVLTAFSLSLFLSLWVFSSCGTGMQSPLQPLTMESGMCSFFMGPEHVQLWKSLFLTFVVAFCFSWIPVVLARWISRVHDGRSPSEIRLRLFEFLHSTTLSWAPLREALASGIIQRGARSQ